MAFANIGIGVVIPLLMLVLWVAVIVAIFQIRTATRDLSSKLDSIYKLMLEKKDSK